MSALAVTGVLQRAQRNEGGLLGIAFVLVIAAAMGWVIAWLLKPETLGRFAGKARWIERLLGGLAVVAFSVGLILAVLAIIWTQQQTQRPTIEAQIAKNAELTATVHASDLTADSRIVIYVDGLQRNPKTPGRYRTVRRIYQAYLGPDSDGGVKEPLSVEIPPSQYSAVGLRAWTTGEEPPCEFSDIDPKKTGTRLGAACVILPLPRVVARPQLVAIWGTGAERRTLHVTASSTQAPPARLVVLRVVAQRSHTTVELARLLAEPDANGKAQVETVVAMPRGAHLVCVDARFINPEKVVARVRCPANRKGPPAAVAQLAVPNDRLEPVRDD